MDVRYIGYPPVQRNPDARACRAASLLDMDHLSLSEVDAWISEKTHRAKLRRHGVAITAADNEHWAALNRVPRRPPIYEDDHRSAPRGAA